MAECDIPVPESEKIGPGIRYRSWYRKKIVPVPENLISSRTFRGWEKEMSLYGKPSPKKTILLMKVYVWEDP